MNGSIILIVKYGGRVRCRLPCCFASTCSFQNCSKDCLGYSSSHPRLVSADGIAPSSTDYDSAALLLSYADSWQGQRELHSSSLIWSQTRRYGTCAPTTGGKCRIRNGSCFSSPNSLANCDQNLLVSFSIKSAP